jgi:hypothetical protein
VGGGTVLCWVVLSSGEGNDGFVGRSVESQRVAVAVGLGWLR